MPHQLTTDLTNLSSRLVGVTKRPQLAEIAADLQKLALLIDAALVDDADERIARLTKRIRLLERCFNHDHTDDGEILFAGVARKDADRLLLTIPAAAGIAQVPFDVAGISARFVEGDLHIEITPDYA